MFQKILGLAEGNDFSISVYGTVFHVLIQDFFSSGIEYFPSFLKDRKARDIKGNLLFEEHLKPNEVYSSIYLIFDYDCQSPSYKSELFKKSLDFFDDETRNGLIFINYPMFESIFDICKEDLTRARPIPLVEVNSINSKTYKKRINETTIFKNKRNGKVFKTVPACFVPLSLVFNQRRYCLLLGKKSFDGTNLNQTDVFLREFFIAKKKGTFWFLIHLYLYY